jgi:hypothetical protein
MHGDRIRRPRYRGLAAAAALAAGTVLAGSGPAAATGALADWAMDETTGSVMHDSAPPTSEQGSIGSLVTLTGHGFEYPGWRDSVDSSGRLKGSVSAGGGVVQVADPNGKFDPGPGLSLVVDLQARLTTQGRLPTKANKGADPSYNVMQKGRANSPGGFWKLELAGSGSQLGKIRCVVGDGRRSAVAVSARRVDDGGWHTIRCELAGGKLTATVDGAPSTVSASSLGAIHPSGQWGTSVWIGKKPGSTDPADAFAGWLRNAEISIS